MGIYDRDYIRREPPRTPLGGSMPSMRAWSVTTWIIVICVAVFVLDTFLPRRVIEVGYPMIHPELQGLPSSAVVEGPVEIRSLPVSVPGGHSVAKENILVRAVLDRPSSEGGQIIGYVQVTEMHFLESLLHFSTQKGFQEFQVWRLIGFQFLHAHGYLYHILFNMIGLFFFGPMIEQHLGRKRFLAFYLLCGIFGALLYVALNLLGQLAIIMMGPEAQIPFLLFNETWTPLIGASAGVFGVLMAGAYIAPNSTVLLFFLLPMRLKTLAYVLFAIAVFSLLTGADNAGGDAGHIGGALAGFYFIRHPHHLHNFFDVLGYADPTSHHYRKGRGGGMRLSRLRPKSRRSKRSDGEIDRILDKIQAQGMHSLTVREKRILNDASRED